MRCSILPLLLLFTIGASHAQGTLKVELILNKPAAGGVLKVALCPSKEAYDEEVGCTLQTVAASGNTVSCTFNGLAPGTYAVKVFHDINSNGVMDTSWIGWPQEPYGFSNDAPVNLGVPSFKLAAIAVKGGTQTSRINLR
jgi:uncharacterized protein (DUF2141 family)